MAATDLITAEQFERMAAQDRWVELDRGVVVRVNPPGFPHGAIAVAIAARLHAFVQPRGLGTVAVESGFTLTRNPDSVRGPDVSFVRRERVDGVRGAGYLAGAPELAVEIRSPGDSMSDLARLAGDYLAAGARLVWIVDPESATVRVCSPGVASRTLTGADVLDGGELLPGFEMTISEVFADL
jgi:Uma2 family endonuclease